jgi:hypothetical protein
MAVHSQTMIIPQCPHGWRGLWIGYSWVMVRLICNIENGAVFMMLILLTRSDDARVSSNYHRINPLRKDFSHREFERNSSSISKNKSTNDPVVEIIITHSPFFISWLLTTVFFENFMMGGKQMFFSTGGKI